jgi:hypothetical protein
MDQELGGQREVLVALVLNAARELEVAQER